MPVKDPFTYLALSKSCLLLGTTIRLRLTRRPRYNYCVVAEACIGVSGEPSTKIGSTFVNLEFSSITRISVNREGRMGCAFKTIPQFEIIRCDSIAHLDMS